MRVAGRTVFITGAAGGIGRALTIACLREGARVLATDLQGPELDSLRALGERCVAHPCDVSDPAAVADALGAVPADWGSVEICFANAGIADGTDPVRTPDDVWDRVLAVNLRHHVWLARALLPGWLERGTGYFVAVASAAGLLTQIGSAPYAVSKHAAVAFAEWLSVTYGDQGVRVSCVCPMGVDTAMLDPGSPGALEPLGSRVVRGAGAVLAAADVADGVLEAMADEPFLILPHPEVGIWFARRAQDPERWLAGMRRLQAGA
jgi:NAD(P)-dependent dehydrogenase (short-subunit alcohol dehydrogenase family)